MPLAPVEVVAPSRLHFGLFSFGDAAELQFGGAGVMIDRPAVRLRVSPGERLEITGPLAERARRVVDQLLQEEAFARVPPCRIEVLESPPEHVGLGTGTQLSLALAAALRAFAGLSPLDALSLAAATGRGERSAVGTYGFLRGGLIVESGKTAGAVLSPLAEHVELPAAWRFVLVIGPAERGLSGEAEVRAFRQLPPVPPETAHVLRREVFEALVPAAAAGCFERFSNSLYRFNHHAGLCFAARQGGPYASGRIARIVEILRTLGVAGVGQSSWGPVVFALVASAEEADSLVDALGPRLSGEETVMVTSPNRGGARFT